MWLVETAGTAAAARDTYEASLGLGPELALELLEGLHRDAKELGDEMLGLGGDRLPRPVRVGAGTAGRPVAGEPSGGPTVIPIS